MTMLIYRSLKTDRNEIYYVLLRSKNKPEA